MDNLQGFSTCDSTNFLVLKKIPGVLLLKIYAREIGKL